MFRILRRLVFLGVLFGVALQVLRRVGLFGEGECGPSCDCSEGDNAYQTYQQILTLEPTRLVLFDLSEVALYEIDRELRSRDAADSSTVEIIRTWTRAPGQATGKSRSPADRPASPAPRASARPGCPSGRRA